MAKKTAKQNQPLKGDQLLQAVEQQSLKDKIPDFSVGDTLEVAVLIREGGKERTQVFTGICIARKGNGVRETFTVRRIVQGEGVERVFPLHSPNITRIKAVRRGKVRRAKLYYLRGRTGKAARVEEDLQRKQPRNTT